VEQLRSIIALLSRIRSKGELDLETAARRQYLFPMVGAIIGALVFFVAFLLFIVFDETLHSLLIGALVVLFLYYVTGIMHIEGLADFADGLMASGDRSRKREAMKDLSLGAAGIYSLIVTLLFMVLLVGSLDFDLNMPHDWVWGEEVPGVLGLVIAELAAKVSMLTTISIGPSSHSGMGNLFVKHATPRKLIAGVIIALLIAIFVSGIYSVIIFTGIATGAVTASIARKHFGGVSGDSFGASNEIGRVVALFAWVVFI